jgi:glycosyltransferase involved in cell wall biosynthesis
MKLSDPHYASSSLMITATAPLPDTRNPPTAPPRLRLAYLLSRFPAVSHSFLLNEIVQLRELGFDIEVASINPPDRPLQALPVVEAEECKNTFYIKSMPHSRAAAIILRTLIQRPRVFFRGLTAALHLGGWNLRALLYGVFYFAEAILLGDWMHRRAYAHLHVHFSTAVATVGLLTSVAWEIPFSLSVHGPDEFFSVPEYYMKQKVERARFILCISEFCRSQLMRVAAPRHWNKFEVVRLGVDPGVFAPGRIEKKMDDGFDIVCVGRLVPAKGQLILVRAFANLLAQGYDVRLKLVGDGEDRKHLQSLVADCGLNSAVEFKGALSHSETRLVLQQADLFVLASFAEGLPVALMEAMAMEIPCVSTYVAGIPELIRDGVDGLLVPASSLEALTDAMKTMIDNPLLRSNLGAAGRKRVLASFNLAENARALAAVFERRLSEVV